MKPTIARLVSAAFVFTLAGCGAGEKPADQGSSDQHIEETASSEITLDNWESHPTIAPILDLLEDATIAEREQLWEREARDGLCDGPGEESRTKLTKDGVIRSLAVRAGSEDSYSVLHAIYDAQGKIRYVESTYRTTHGTGQDQQVFFDEQGRMVWEVIQDWLPGDDGLGVPQAWRLPHAEDDEPFAFDDPRFVDAPASVFDRAPTCD